jgi:hypothetical protein
LLFRCVIRSCHQAEGNILVQSSVVRPHIPLGIRSRANELEERVSRWIVQYYTSRLERFLGINSEFLVLVIYTEQFSKLSQEGINLRCVLWVHCTTQDLIHTEITDCISQDTLDIGKLTSSRGDRELIVGQSDGGVVGFDKLSTEVFSSQEVDSVCYAFG